MRKLILSRVLWAEAILDERNVEGIEDSISDLSRWITLFQHERHMHLIVTALFAILTMLSVILLVLAPSYAIIILIVFFSILMLSYVRHYYVLENNTQKLYLLLDKMYSLKRGRLKESSTVLPLN